MPKEENNMDKAQGLHEIRSGRAELKELLARVEPGQMDMEKVLYENWSVKDLLAHLGFWERRAATILKALQAGQPVPPLGEGSMDDVNARNFAANHFKMLADVRAEEEAAYQELLALTESAPENDLFDPQRFEWTRGQPFFDWIEGNSYGHYQEHLPALIEWVNKN
jgi:hypothetical protein